MPTGERAGRAPEDDVRLLLGGVRRVVGQPAQVARSGGRVGPVAAPVDEQPRHDAADQRHHQQQVDRGEPRRVVDPEQPEPVVDRRQVRVGRLPVLGLERVDPVLRDHRAGDRAERQQEQQDERRPHRGQLAPGPAHQLPRGQLARPPVVVAVAARLPGAGLLRALARTSLVLTVPSGELAFARTSPPQASCRPPRALASLTGSPSSSRPGGSAASSRRGPTSR